MSYPARGPVHRTGIDGRTNAAGPPTLREYTHRSSYGGGGVSFSAEFPHPKRDGLHTADRNLARTMHE